MLESEDEKAHYNGYSHKNFENLFVASIAQPDTIDKNKCHYKNNCIC